MPNLTLQLCYYLFFCCFVCKKTVSIGISSLCTSGVLIQDPETAFKVRWDLTVFWDDPWSNTKNHQGKIRRFSPGIPTARPSGYSNGSSWWDRKRVASYTETQPTNHLLMLVLSSTCVGCWDHVLICAHHIRNVSQNISHPLSAEPEFEGSQ